MKDSELLSPELQAIDAVVARRKGQHGELLGILEEAQQLCEGRYLSEEVLNHVALRTDTPLSRIYNVVTFYSFFNLKPQGAHTVTVCRGTACHTKGSKALLDDLGLMLGCSNCLADGETSYTTPDHQFTITTVACFGQCALAPVIALDGVIHSNVNTASLQKLLTAAGKGRRRP